MSLFCHTPFVIESTGAQPSKIRLLRIEEETPDFMLHLLVLKSACGSRQSPLEVAEELQRQSYESRCHPIRYKERIDRGDRERRRSWSTRLS